MNREQRREYAKQNKHVKTLNKSNDNDLYKQFLFRGCDKRSLVYDPKTNTICSGGGGS